MRKYVGAVHEYPAVRGEIVIPTPYRDRMEFLHLKVDHKHYRTPLIIETMLKDIEDGHTRWLPYLGEEYRADGQYDQAMLSFRQYLRLNIRDPEHPQHLKKTLEEMLATLVLRHGGDERQKWESFKAEFKQVDREVDFLRDSPIFWEYYAVSVWYTVSKEVACLFHERAKSLDPEKQDVFIWQNDQFY